MWELCVFKVTRTEMRAMLGDPHYVETDSFRTYGGEEDWWAYTLLSGQRLVIVLRVPYKMATFNADPPELPPILRELRIPVDDSRLQRNPQPIPAT
jgi:hypothetical protein